MWSVWVTKKRWGNGVVPVVGDRFFPLPRYLLYLKLQKNVAPCWLGPRGCVPCQIETERGDTYGRSRTGGGRARGFPRPPATTMYVRRADSFRLALPLCRPWPGVLRAVVQRCAPGRGGGGDT